MSLSHGILGFLTYGEMSGYDLAKAFGSSLDFFWHAQNSHIYLELKKLEGIGYISGTYIPQQDKPNKKVYHLTDSGRQEFYRWLGEKDTDFSREIKSSFLMKVFFSGSVPPAQSIAMLRGFIAGCEDYLSELSETPKSIQQYGQSVEPYQALYWEMTSDFGNGFMELCIRWAKRCIARLEELN